MIFYILNEKAIISMLISHNLGFPGDRLGFPGDRRVFREQTQRPEGTAKGNP